MTNATCPGFSSLDGQGGVAGALRAVDCLAAQTTEKAFSTLLGPDGALGQALTLLLTLYVALMAIRMLTGRTGVGLSSLTPRMLGLGLVLCFATSWAAYHQVVWNLLVGAPDHLASLLAGTRGSAPSLFADRLDQLFQLVLDAARQSTTAGGEKPTLLAGMRPADLLWIASLLLLFGTVGVLVASKIALAALLALGPVFIVLALFRATSGLFEGWLRAALLFAIVPLLTVLVGTGALALIAPMLSDLALAGGTPTPELAVSVLLGAAVFSLLMLLVLRVAASLTAGWRLNLHGQPDTVRGQAGSARAGATLVTVPAPAATAARASASAQSNAAAALSGAALLTQHSFQTAPRAAAMALPGGLSQPGDAARLNPAATVLRNRQTQGLGQRFRRPAVKGT
ncbi:type IV secretion system protein [Asticcacaulis sp.]|uniref:type IV secretion system protein n=1 Tax=Asticcacaulis sp. TaxID=1872648 RepID=UPI002604BFCA|nr:type IV secretion system protein [Asticcacaulis sp.]